MVVFDLGNLAICILGLCGVSYSALHQWSALLTGLSIGLIVFSIVLSFGKPESDSQKT